MDNPAAILTDDVSDWNPGRQGGTGTLNQTDSAGTDAPRTASPPSHQKSPQQHYRRNVSTCSIDIPATLGLMVTNNGSTTSSTMKLTEYSSSGSNSSSLDDGTPPAAFTIPIINDTGSINGTGVNGRPRKGGKKQPRYDPFKMRDKAKATTDSGALLHLVKSSLGSGILAMPNAFKNGGLFFGLFGTAAIGALCTHCIYLLVLCSQALAQRTRRPALGFADTAAAAFKTGPRRFRSWAPFAKEFVNAALFCTYYFGNTVYVVLVAASFKQVADTHTPPEWHFSVRAWILGLAIPLVPLGIIRTLRVLVPFSAIATAFILVGLGCTMSWVVTGVSMFAGEGALAAAIPLPDIDARPWIASIGQMPLFFATVLFAMEGIGTVLPIENSMRHPQRFLTARPCGVLNSAMTLVVILYSIAGFLGYLRFGNATDGSITLNLPNDLFAQAVKLMVALSILFSYGLQFCVPSEIVWTRLEPWLRKRRQNKYPKNNGLESSSNVTVVSTITGNNVTVAAAVPAPGTVDVSASEKKQLELELDMDDGSMDGAYYIMRAVMILGTVLIAALVPDLAPFISLIGSIFFSILGLMCPAVIHLFTFWEHDDESGESSDSDTDSEDGLDFDGDYHPVDEDTDPDDVNRQQGRRSSGRTTHRKKGMNRWTMAKDMAIVMIALIALVSGTYASLVDIVAFYEKGPEGAHRHPVNGTRLMMNITAATTSTTIGPGPESAFLIADIK